MPYYLMEQVNKGGDRRFWKKRKRNFYRKKYGGMYNVKL
jgi:hypothetical protein